MSSKEYFETVADQWDEMRQDFFSEAVREAAYEKAGVTAGETAADVGAGTGFVTEGLIARGLNVVAVDESPQMLQTMQHKFVESDRVQYRIGEAEALPIRSGSVNYAFANMFLHHVESPAASILEMARIIKPGGKLVITDLDAHTFDFLKTEHHDRWMGFIREDVTRWFEDAGLTEVSVDCVGQSCRSESCCGQKAAISIFVACGRKPTPEG